GLLVSLHYGPYTSLLPLALARARPPVSFLLDLRLDPTLVLPDDRLRELEGADVVPAGGLGRIDAAEGGAAALRRLRDVLDAGGAAVVFADAYFRPPEDRRALPFPLGRRTLRLPRGAAWLAEATGCAVAAVCIHPEGRGHRVDVRAAPDVT